MTRLLAVPQLNHTVDICEEEVEKLLERITKSSSEGKACDLTNEPTTLTNNTICRMALSMRFSGTENKAEEIQVLVKQCLELAGKLTVGDTLGPQKTFDFSGDGKKAYIYGRWDSLRGRWRGS